MRRSLVPNLIPSLSVANSYSVRCSRSIFEHFCLSFLSEVVVSQRHPLFDALQCTQSQRPDHHPQQLHLQCHQSQHQSAERVFSAHFGAAALSLRPAEQWNGWPSAGGSATASPPATRTLSAVSAVHHTEWIGHQSECMHIHFVAVSGREPACDSKSECFGSGQRPHFEPRLRFTSQRRRTPLINDSSQSAGCWP